MEKELICIVCPKGCVLKVKAPSGGCGITGAEASGITEADVSGHRCKRGPAYAINECTNPLRTLTTTVRVIGGKQPLVSVKSAAPLPKGLLFDCMAVINSHAAQAPIRVGDILVKNILNTGIDIVSTSNIAGEDTYGPEAYHRT
jgi:CxxC motif-containing protein